MIYNIFIYHDLILCYVLSVNDAFQAHKNALKLNSVM